MDRGSWRATVHRVTKSQTGLKRLSRQAVITPGTMQAFHLSALNNCILLRLPQCLWNMAHTCFVLKKIFIAGISTALVG